MLYYLILIFTLKIYLFYLFRYNKYNRYENIKKMHLFLNKIKTEIK